LISPNIGQHLALPGQEAAPPLAPLAGGRAGQAKTPTQPAALSRRVEEGHGVLRKDAGVSMNAGSVLLSRRGSAEAETRARWKQVAEAVYTLLP